MLATGGAGEDEPKSLTDREGSPLFALPNDPSRATLLNKLREPERKQEDEDNLVEFMKNQGKDTPQNKKRVWKVDVSRRGADCSAGHGARRKTRADCQQRDAVRGITQGRQRTKHEEAKCLARWGTGMKKGRTHLSCVSNHLILNSAKCGSQRSKRTQDQWLYFMTNYKTMESFAA